MIGIDLIEIERIEQALCRHGDHFLSRIFTEREREDCKQAHRLAGRFAAKEAVAKALGVGIGEHLTWQEIEIRNNEQGIPYVILSDRVNAQFGDPSIALSISHSKTHATAVALRKI